MTKGQSTGIVAIAAGVLLFVPLLFWVVGVRVYVNGQDMTFLFDDNGRSFLAMLEYIGSSGATVWMWIIWIGTILLITLSVVLITFGIILTCRQFKGATPWTQGLVMVAGGIALIVAVTAIIEVIHSNNELRRMGEISEFVPGLGWVNVRFGAVIGFGAIFLAVMAVLAMVMAVVASLFRDKTKVAGAGVGVCDSQVVGVQQVQQVSNVPGLDNLAATLARFKEYKEDGVITEEQYKKKVKEAIDKNLLAE